jgi:GntR family transcriptional regulator, phosphonate transport system regulatory protein
MPDAPLWQQISDALRADLAGGRYPPGARLPTEAALAARFGANRHTVRRALAALAADGLVAARRGAGVFVRAAPTDYALGRRPRFRANIAAAGRTPESRLLRLETRAADRREAAALALSPGNPVHVAQRLGLADGAPVSLATSVFPAARLPGLPEALRATGSITAALAACGVADYTRARTRISAEPASASEARHLLCAEGAPLLRTVSVNVDADGRPVEYGRTLFPGDRVQLVVDGPG